MTKLLDFEKPIDELYKKINELRRLSQEGNVDLSSEITSIKKRAEALKKEIYKNLTPAQIVQIARHPDRLDTLSIINLVFENFVELHGDRLFKDDEAIVSGIGTLDNFKVAIIGHQKGHNTKENIRRNFGSPHPEGYRKALRIMKLAEKFKMPIITFIDTQGAYCGIGAEERGQAEAIARNLKEMALLKTPVITFVIGEGGSGGALAIGIANKLYMLENAVYSVISPEGCASILFRDAGKASFAAENLKITAQHVLELGVADGIVNEPLGGSHYDWNFTAANIKSTILKNLKHYKNISFDKIISERYDKFRKLGQFDGANNTTV